MALLCVPVIKVMSYNQLYIGHLKRDRSPRMDSGDWGGASSGDFRTALPVSLALFVTQWVEYLAQLSERQKKCGPEDPLHDNKHK